MQYRTLGKTGIKASAVAFGGILLNEMAAPDAERAVAGAVEAGVNYFDVAPSYGNAQYVMGPALQKHRGGVTLACKSNKLTAKELDEELEESLKALKTDHFDVYQLHGCDEGFDTIFGPKGAMEAIERAKKAGKIRFVGFSSHRERSALYLMSQYEFDTMMQPMNWAVNLNNGKSDLALKLAGQKGMGLLAIKTLVLRPLKEGEPRRYPNCWYMPICDDDALAALAMRFTLNRAHVAVSPGELKMLELMVKLIDKPGSLDPLSEQEMAYLKAEAAKIKPLFND